MNWIFLDENYNKTPDFAEDSIYCYVKEGKLQELKDEYDVEFNCEDILEDCWMKWSQIGFTWSVVADSTIERNCDEALKRWEKLSGEKTPPFTDKITTLYKVAVEVEPVGTVYLDCVTSNIDEAVAAISLAANANIFGKRAKRFTIEVVRE